MEATLRHFRTTGTKSLGRLLNGGLGFILNNFNQELDQRNAQRKENSGQWLRPEEAAVAEALAKIIVPSDEESPGIDEVCFLGPRAISSLDKMIRECTNRQHLYSRGLLSFDIWALREHGCKFVELSTEQQTNLFRGAQEINDSWKVKPALTTRLWRRFAAIRRGAYYAGLLYPRIREDSLQIFYTSRVSWVWLGYDGPPMERGYSNLTQPR
jgi:hypothetical protein